MLSFIRKFLAIAASFSRAKSAVGAVEFAISFPVMVLLLVGGYETANFARASMQVEVAANSIAQMLSQAPASSGATAPGNGLTTGAQLHFFYDSIMYTLPDAMSSSARRGGNWWDLAKLAIWSVEFKPTPANCGSNCTYTPVVVWAFNGGSYCGAQIKQVADTSTPTKTTLPASLYGPGSVIIVQVSYDYYPSFGSHFVGSTTITRTAMLSPRNVPLVESNDYAENAGNCPGTP